MPKLEKGQNVNKPVEDTYVELDDKMSMELDDRMSMDAELIGKFITQQFAAAIDDKTKHYEKKIKNWIKVDRMEYRGSWQKTEQGAVDAPPKKRKYPRLR